MQVFLSFNTKDERTAVALKAAIETRDPEIEVFQAHQDLRKGQFWQPQLQSQLDGADAVLLLLGAEGPGPWQRLEYYEALARKAHEEHFPIVALLISDRTPGLPFLRQLHWIASPVPQDEPVLTGIIDALKGGERAQAELLWQVINPYHGLSALREEDAEFFFGRETETAKVLNAVAGSGGRVVTLIGNSGVGKSSLVQAGVIGSLKRQRMPTDAPWPASLKDSRKWAYLTMKPGDNPTRALASAFVGQWFLDPTDPLRHERIDGWEKRLNGNGRLSELLDATEQQFEKLNIVPPPRFLLCVDQGEELYSRGAPAAVTRFSQLIAEGLNDERLLVMNSQRSDYYGRLQDNDVLFELTSKIDVRPLGPEQLKTVLGKPAELLGAAFENEALVDKLVAAGKDQPGALPLLADLMTELWTGMQDRQPPDGLLRMVDEEKIVEIVKPLAARADAFLEMYADLSHEVERLFTLKLVHVPDKGEPVRQRVTRSRCSQEEWALIERLAGPDWRLLTTGVVDDEPMAEVAHEVLIAAWPQLREWIAAQREFLSWKGETERARKTYEAASDRDKVQALLHALNLSRAEQWLAQRGDDIEPAERAFIEKSVARREGQKARIRTAVAATIVVLVGFLGIALHQWSEATSAANQARFAEQLAKDAAKVAQASADMEEAAKRDAEAATKRALAALVMLSQSLVRTADDQTLSGQPVVGTLLALEVLPDKTSKDPVRRNWPQVIDAETSLHRSYSQIRELAVLKGHTWVVSSAAFSGDGGRIVTASADSTARLWDGETGQEIAVLKGHTDSVWSAAFNGDGSRIVTASAGNTARLWDGETGQEIAVLKGHTGSVSSAAFNGDGSRIVTASWDNTVRLWDGETGQEIAVLKGHSDVVQSAAFNGDGSRIVTASSDNTARLWDGETGQEIAVLKSHTDNVWSAAFNGDGSRIVTASSDNTARLWDGETGQEIAVLKGHTDSVSNAAFNGDGSRIVTASLGNTARLWDGETGQEIAVLKGHTGSVSSAAFNGDGSRIVTASSDSTAWLWDGETGQEIAVLKGHTGSVSSAAFNGDGSRIVTASDDGTARLWDGETGQEIAVLKGHTDSVWSVAFNGDGSRIVTASWDNTARLWHGETGQEIAVLKGHTDNVSSAAFNGDGSRIVTASWDNTARLWDGESGQEIAVLKGHTDSLSSAAFNSDGSRIVTASWDNTARLRDGESGQEIAVLKGHEHIVSSPAFNGDGSRIVTASADGTARLWDGESGQEIAVLKGHTDSVWSAAFNGDGSRIVTASADNTAQLWRVFRTTQRLIDRAKAVVPRCLTVNQRREFSLAPGPPRWCITGVGREKESDPNYWRGKWPYDTPEWKGWLAARDRGENPPLPGTVKQ